MRTKLATGALAGVLAVSGIAGAVLAAPAVAYAATGDSTALDARVASITRALSSLVTDGSITQAQADEVATTLAEVRPDGLGHGGRGGPGGRGRLDLAAAAEALGITQEELRAQTRAGRTLADVAEAEGVAEADLVDALVAAARTRLAQAVTAGRLTQAEADARAVDLEARVTDSLDELCGPGGRGGPGDDAAEEGTTPSTAPSAGTGSGA